MSLTIKEISLTERPCIELLESMTHLQHKNRIIKPSLEQLSAAAVFASTKTELENINSTKEQLLNPLHTTGVEGGLPPCPKERSSEHPLDHQEEQTLSVILLHPPAPRLPTTEPFP